MPYQTPVTALLKDMREKSALIRLDRYGNCRATASLIDAWIDELTALASPSVPTPPVTADTQTPAIAALEVKALALRLTMACDGWNYAGDPKCAEIDAAAHALVLAILEPAALASSAGAQSVPTPQAPDLQPLKDACDRTWTNETPEQVIAIAANALYWRGQEINRLLALLSPAGAQGAQEKEGEHGC